MSMRGAVVALSVLAAGPAFAEGGWKICIYGPTDVASTWKIHFQYKHCWTSSAGTTSCDKEWQQKSVDTEEGYVSSTSLQSYWDDADVARLPILQGSTGYFLIRFDRSFVAGFQEKIMRTRTLPFREVGSRPKSACERYDTTYQFMKEGYGLNFYNGCPQATSDCADKWR